MADAFTFVRVVYDSIGGQDEAWYYYEGRMWQRWETDYPEAEENFLLRLGQLTTLRVAPKPQAMRLTDENLGRYPFIYMSDVGWQILNQQEQAALRDYLLTGGFLWVDDFWGNKEWENLEFNMHLVFPDLHWRDIPVDHAIMNLVFALEECPQVPARDFAFRIPGQHWDPPQIHRGRGWREEEVIGANFRGLFSEDGRLLAVATHNTDIGDGWEREATDQRFFETYSVKAYALGVNIITYAMTH
jgi:hypothetical protein